MIFARGKTYIRRMRTATITCALMGAGIVLGETSAALSTLPLCVEDAGVIAEIRSAQKSNPKTSYKYDGYRKALAADTPLQLATRLAYAETLAANCPQRNEGVAELTTAVIGNRIRIRNGDVASVVFQRDQFSSSLNIYPESRYRDFLCPKDARLWATVSAKMRASMDASKPATGIPDDVVNYYLHLHSQRFTAPDWKLEEFYSPDENLRLCIRSFRDSRWK